MRNQKIVIFQRSKQNKELQKNIENMMDDPDSNDLEDKIKKINKFLTINNPKHKIIKTNVKITSLHEDVFDEILKFDGYH